MHTKGLGLTLRKRGLSGLRVRLPGRFLRYLIERFSLYSMVPACAIQYLFITHVAGVSAQWNDWPRWLTGFVTYIGVFLLLRLLDDMKDKRHDDRFYGERPVQRGLISLQELAWLAGALLVVLTAANLLWSTPAGIALYAATLGYITLMRAEFFAPAFLRPRLLLYLLLHQVFVPLLVAYVIYHHGARLETTRDLLFLALNLLMVMAVEVARKIRPSALDQTGRDTYSAYLGRRGALIFLYLIACSVQCLFVFLGLTSPWLAPLLLLPLLAGLYYDRTDSRAGSQLILGATVVFLTVNMLAAL
jgi:4-hydroxybenzoate polyprenyltransferase